MKLIIHRLDNGYSIHGEEVKEVFEDGDDEFGELDSMEKLLWAVMDYFGQMGSRHDAQRLRITREPGDKYMDGQEGHRADDSQWRVAYRERENSAFAGSARDSDVEVLSLVRISE
jgi:hypothetical protein